MKKQYLFGILLSLLFGYLAFRNIDVREFMHTLRSIDGWWIPLTITALFLGFVFRAIRWRYMMLPVKSLEYKKIFSAMMIGYLALNILPMRMGEIVRAYTIKKTGQISGSSALATIILERVLDLFFIVLCIYSIVFLVPVQDYVLRASHFLLLIVLTMVLVFILLINKRDATLRTVQKILTLLPEHLTKRVLQKLNSFIKGLDFLKATHHYGVIGVLTILMWLFYALSFYFLFLIFGLDLPAVATVVIIGMTAIGMMIPAAPGAIGTFHLFCIEALVIFGLSKQNASSFAVIVHAIQYIFVVVIGLFFLMQTNIHLAAISLSDVESE